ncbi:Oidioi.mRNA.OKI2018_I69.chr2.g8402.t1.cds [Oikopleura dioica]|uniref:Oidioi.mRNA.OKI2018_I69.chr2.g8402.t1.cds n=1 Tax=Oikopleura dioica TaxID=34765 RepID=A0ABN7TFA4_OIKDI|nr:Oidioi.mRNA.OKI2018_I69.chr2.g8402.t1.cds [Oikopleura dioica]
MEVARREIDPFRWNFNIPKELYRVPLFIMIEALVSGRILHDSTPTWISVQLWLGSIIPLFLHDDKIPQYYRLVLVYIGHCMLNLVDAFLLNLTRPDSPPIYGLIGLAPMELPDFQYLVRVAFMLFNLIFFRATLSNLMIIEPEDEDSRWSFSQLPAIAVGYNNIFEEENTDPETQVYAHMRTGLRLMLETLMNNNPAFGIILKILLHSMIIKSVLHAISTYTHFGKSVESLIESSPDIEKLSITSLNSSGLAMMNMSAFGLHEFVEMQYFGDYMPSTIVSSIVLITTDSLFSVFAVAYFLSGPGVWLGVAIQRWLGNGEEPNDPEERGQRMGQFLGMLHGFMALQTGITFMSPEERFERAYKNSWLEVVACLHYLHEIVDAELNSNHVDGRSVSRPLQAMFALFLIPLCIEIELLKNHEISTWSIPVFVFTLELIVKAVTSFAVYWLNQNDADEDTIFWTKTASKGVELLGGIVMLINAIYVLIFERPIMTVVRILMMTIHTYFNIYRTFTKTAKSIKLRLQTADLLDKLKVVDVSEIPEPDRLCAICYEDFAVQTCSSNPVVETSCQHRFHKLCIKKWLRLKNVCPLCHRPVFTSASQPGASDDQNQNALILDNDDDDLF